MNDKAKRLIFAVEGIQDLLVEGLNDTQYENWKDEIDELFNALDEIRGALDMGKKP